MQVSLNWLKRYLPLDYTPEEIATYLTSIGLEVEGLEATENIKGGLEGIVVGQVTSCEKHPDADRLAVTLVDIGNGEHLQIVCGAPNVKNGQKVMVATIGTKLYNSPDGTPWSIKKGKIRGVESQGMICAEDELGIGNDHSGIIVLPDNVVIGTKASEYYHVSTDTVFEVGLTPNRSDATSHLGVARDLLAYLKVHKNYSEDLRHPDISGFSGEKVISNIKVTVEDTYACPRYSGITIHNVDVKPSPQWLTDLLKSVGIRPINNIVDITNFVLHELGQPLHAFDADRIDDGHIIVKSLPAGTPFVTLDGIERKLNDQDLMICDGSLQGLCIAGVFGGRTSGVSSETKTVFLESAFFHSASIRKTSTRHNLRTDAAKAYEKGADPNITVFALKRAASLIADIAGGTISNDIIDIYPHPIVPLEVQLKYSKVSEVLGLDIPHEHIQNILMSMDMEIQALKEDTILVRIPTNKTDVTREIDLIEEIIRIYGLDLIPVPHYIKSTLTYTQKPDRHTLKEKICQFLSAKGYNEMMGLSLIESRKIKNVVDTTEDDWVYINNTSNVHLDILRPDMMVSGLINIEYNINRQQNNLRLYEMGKTYLRQATSENREEEFLSIFHVGARIEQTWHNAKAVQTDFFDAKSIALNVLKFLGIDNCTWQEIEQPTRFDYGLSIHALAQEIGHVGLISQHITQHLGIKLPIFYIEFKFNALLSLLSQSNTKVVPISKFPNIRRDIAIIVDEKITFDMLNQHLMSQDKKHLKNVTLFDIYRNEAQIGKNKKSYALSLTFESLDKTMTDIEIDAKMNKITKSLHSQFEAILRQ